MTEYVGQVEFPGMRSELIFTLLDLSDADYQQREWIEKWEGNPSYRQYSFDGNLEFICVTLEDRHAFDYFEKKIPLAQDIGYWLKTTKEAEALSKVAEYLLPMAYKRYTNQQYLSSPYLPKLRKAAKEAFDIFMANEQDEPKFVARVERVKQEHAGNASSHDKPAPNGTLSPADTNINSI